MALNWVIRDAEPDDAWVIIQKLRVRDYEEAVAAGGDNVLATLTDAITRSAGMCWVAENNQDGAVLLLGCAPVEGVEGLGSPWLVGTKPADRYPGALTKIAKRHIAIMLKTYSALLNFVDARNDASVRWLAFLGFKIDPPTPYGVEGRPFHRFTMGV